MLAFFAIGRLLFKNTKFKLKPIFEKKTLDAFEISSTQVSFWKFAVPFEKL